MYYYKLVKIKKKGRKIILRREIYERSRDKKRCKAGDGSGSVWRLRVTRYSEKNYDLKPNFDFMNKVSSIWEIPL